MDRKNLFNYIIIKIIILLIPVESMAVNTLKGASDSLFEGANILTKFFWAACIFVGMFLLTASFTNYREHKNNPKLIPLSTVIVYFFLGLAVISIPFLNRLFGPDGYDLVHGVKY